MNNLEKNKNELKPFNPQEKIIEYMLDNDTQKLVDFNLSDFADETAGESMAPGGGSIAAYVGTLGVALGTMVANLSGHKAGWDDRWEEFSVWAEKGQSYKKRLLYLVDEDTNAFNKIIDGFRMPKSSEEEKTARLEAIESATIYATEVPFQVMETAFNSMEVSQAMLKDGMQTSLSDSAVGILCAKTAVTGAYFNVKINAKDIKDRVFAEDIINRAEAIYQKTVKIEQETIEFINSKM